MGRLGQGFILSELLSYLDRARDLQVALQNNLFEIGDEGETIPAIMRRTGILPHKLPPLINGGIELGAMHVKGGTIFLTDVGKLYLRSDSPYSMRDVLLWPSLDYQEFLDGFVKEEHPEVFTAEMAKAMVQMMHQKSAGLAAHWPTQVDLSEAKVLLDLGAGSAVHAIEACKRFKNLQAIALDLPPICPVTQEFVEGAGMAEQVRVFPCNMFTEDLPRADVAVMSDVAHDWDNERVALLLRRVFESLASGGRLFLLEVLLNEDKAGPVRGHLLRLSGHEDVARRKAANCCRIRGHAPGGWLRKGDLHPQSLRGQPHRGGQITKSIDSLARLIMRSGRDTIKNRGGHSRASVFLLAL